MTDENGDYQVFVNIQIPIVGFASTTVTVVDPVTHAVLGSKTIDLSSSVGQCSDLEQALAVAISDLHFCDCVAPEDGPCPTAAISACYASAYNLIGVLMQNLIQACTIAVH